MENSICSLIQIIDKDDNILIQSSDKRECGNSLGVNFVPGIVAVVGISHCTIETVSYEVLSETRTPPPQPIPTNWVGELIPYCAIIRVKVRVI